MPEPTSRVAVIDYGMGNLFSVQRACERAGMEAMIVSSAKGLEDADAIILPGVGAFGDAMQSLKNLNLIESLRSLCHSGKPIMGVCLGMQLLMEESYEFGHHEGLGILKGSVVPFENPTQAGQSLKVPHIGWNRLHQPSPKGKALWSASPLQGLSEGTYMYFVHSYYVKPTAPDIVLSVSSYGHIEFCSSLLSNNIFACQYHPERSGPDGLRIYANFKSYIRHPRGESKKNAY